MHRPTALLTTVLALGLAACGGQATDGEAGPTPTVTRTTTATETETGTVTETVTGTDTPTEPSDDERTPQPGSTIRAQQTFIVGPQEPVTVAPSDPHGEGGVGLRTFSALGRYDQGDIPPTLDFTVLPCSNVTFGSGRVGFVDEDGNGIPDRMGSSNRGEAFVAELNGVPYDPDGPRDLVVTNIDAEGGEVDVALNSEFADCAIPTFFLDRDGDERLDLGGDPEPFGVAKITWQER